MSFDGVKKINENIIKDGRSLVFNTLIDNIDPLPSGTLYIDGNTGNVKFIHYDLDTNTKSWDTFKFENIFKDNSFNDSLIADNTLNGAKITDLSIVNDKLVDNSITNDKLKDNTISTEKIKEIDATKLKDNSITTTKFINESIKNDFLINKTITNEKIQDKTITSNLIADNSINYNHLIDKFIDEDKIKDNSITHKLLTDNCIESNNICDNIINTNHIVDGSITTDKLAKESITADKIPNFSITDILIRDIDGSKINPNSIVSAKLKDHTIETEKIKDEAITSSKLSNDLLKKINSAIKVEEVLKYDDKQYIDTAFIEGNLLVKNKSNDCNVNIAGNLIATGDITGGRVFNPYFADVAEAYIPDEYLSPGDPVCLCKEGNLKVEKLNDTNADRFIGFVSDDYATLFGGTKEEIKNKQKVAITLIGRIKIKAGLGYKLSIGDYIQISDDGLIVTTFKQRTNKSIGRVLENKSENEAYVLCQLWP